jgi:hypothetical protein
VLRLEGAYDAGAVDANTIQGQQLLTVLGRYRSQIGQDYVRARAHFAAAARSTFPDHRDCAAVQLASMLYTYPPSVSARDEGIAHYFNATQELLRRPSLDLTRVADADPYVFCILSAFVRSPASILT